jgi:predicted O-methyltransferase YrrM
MVAQIIYLKALISRILLFKNGLQKGVSVAWLSSSQQSISTELSRFIDVVPKFDEEMKQYLEEGLAEYERAVRLRSGQILSADWDAGPNLCAILYSYIRASKPKIIVETGVANGITTNVIISALEKSGGVLHSFDVLPECRNVASDSRHWEFHIFPRKGSRKALKSAILDLKPVDVWIHDSDHGSLWQEFEFRLALDNLAPNGVLISDDIDASSAWGELSKSFFDSACGFFDKRKMIGVATKK